MSASDFASLQPSLSLVELKPPTILANRGDPIRNVYFPHFAVISLVSAMSDGAKAETATIGSEGAVGVEAVLGMRGVPNIIQVQVSGTASQIAAKELIAAVHERATLRNLILRYIGAFEIQLAQSVACNSLHKLEARCARWLLMTHDRARRDTFMLTHEFLSEMLGVHRPAVTIIASKFQAIGLLHYRRGKVTILDRKGLEEASCECYWLVKSAHDHIFEELFAR